MIEKGLLGFKDKDYDKIIDRKEAIIMALEEALENDIVLIAGKGHEDYQEFSDHRIHFS
jgi:UDP-N-acetylmuramoyl-L-alanyl-D-glutamate--2,6-diaminopimelate ligase